MKIIGIIPARYASTRLPGKPLIDILGKTMVQRVYEQAAKAKNLADVYVATDDERIYDHVQSFGGKAVMTAQEHPSGTDRCREAVQTINTDCDYIINIQGDEPLIDPQQIDLITTILNGTTELATLIKTAANYDELANTGEVKVTLNTNNEALYFSRSIIPFVKGTIQKNWIMQHTYFLHVGMYAYRTDVLDTITKLPVSSLEKSESLEQLRWLENGYKIKCVMTDIEAQCVDTQTDLEKVIAILKEREA